ncbi:MAG TPA: 50S ribosomal protein L3 [Firmicutes bacterium]|nr:50S ribosomal protein L3 [Bacillota bacterium]
MKGILGRKAGMTQVFTKEGKVIPVTVIEVVPNIVTQIKTKELDGYEAVQLGIVDRKEKNATKASIGHAKKANTNPKRFLKEIRDVNIADYALGQELNASVFAAGEIVDVTGTSKGKGFQGVIKRHGQSEGPKTHGSRYHRRPGSMGTMRPMRVLKGKNLAGHMGCETVTVQNLEIIEVSVADGYILVSGNVPGPKNSLVLIRSAVKGGTVSPKEIISFENSVENVIEESSTDVEPTTVENTPVEDDTTPEETVSEEAKTEEAVEETSTEETTESVPDEEKAEA